MNGIIVKSQETNTKQNIKLISEMVEDKQVRLLGHILRCDHNDPLYQATFTDEGSYNVYNKRRVGRPQGFWAESTMGVAMTRLQDVEFERDNPNHYVYLISEAINIII